ncbi:MAG: hypothetical protein PVG65_04565 [Candidatus Thorarchaeota archaeon]|jgi:hypothetical protein
MWRAGVIYKEGKIEAKNFPNKPKAENWVLSLAEKDKIKRSVIVNTDNIKERYFENW